MRVAYDGKTDTAYVLFTEYDDSEVARWRVLADHEIEGMFTFDFDKRGRLLGIEVKMASMALPQDVVDDADRI